MNDFDEALRASYGFIASRNGSSGLSNIQKRTYDKFTPMAKSKRDFA